MPALGARVLSACSLPRRSSDADCGNYCMVRGHSKLWWTRFTGAPPPPPHRARAARAVARSHTGTTQHLRHSCTSCTVYSQLRHTEITPRLGPRGLRGVGYVRTARLVCRRDESRLGAADDLLGRTTSSCSSGADERRLGAKSASRSVTTTASAPSNESNART